MKKIASILICLFILFSCTDTFAHKRAKYNIVIDTDGGIDDLRALTYFMASRDFNINAITTVDGVLEPNLSAQYIRQLCDTYHHEGILVGKGESIFDSSVHFKHALQVWENLFEIIADFEFEESVSLLSNSIDSEDQRTIIIAMGPLSNIAELVEKHPELHSKIEFVLWYSNFNEQPVGYNYNLDNNAFDLLIEKQIPVKMITSEDVKYSDSFLTVISEINSIYAETINKAFRNTEFDENRMQYWDDLLPFYLLYPSMFTEENVLEYANLVKPNSKSIFDILVTSVLNFDKPDQGVVFNEVPTDGFMLRNDVGKFSDSIIEAHGYAEYKLVAITSEIHSHMGVYSVFGAKTGLRIMEYLHAGLDEIEIVSYAGFNPPISCFNDGLQVGTGSTIGYGTISVDTSVAPTPAVLVKYNGREILFSIKPEILEEIKADIRNLIQSYGLDNEMYWIQLRELTIRKYWLGMSRFDILDIEELK